MTESVPQISIIIPVFETERYLDKCLGSILNSDFVDYEILLIDDGSPNGYECDKFADERIRVIHKKNEGVSAARNEGLRLARAPFISFVDSDDFVHPKMFTHLYDLINAHNVDYVSCSSYEIIESETEDVFANDNVDLVSGHITSLNGSDALKMFLLSSPITPSVVWGRLYKRHLFEDVQFPIRKVSGDAAVAFKIHQKAQSIVHSEAKLYCYVIRDNSITNSGFSPITMQKLLTSREIIDSVSKTMPELADYATCFHIVTALRIAAYFDRNNRKVYPNEYKEIRRVLQSTTSKNNALLARRHKLLLFLFFYCNPAFLVLWKRRLKAKY